MKVLRDEDPMPFGKYRGERMEDVPADYLFYLWTECRFEHDHGPVAEYIRANLDTLEIDYPDGIWRND